MRNPNKTESLNGEQTVEGILRHIECHIEVSPCEDDYLFRGEPEHYQEPPYEGKVSSKLCRFFLEREDFDVEAEHFDIEHVQTVMLNAARRFFRKTLSDFEILAEIQHYGGRTNLIDFTKDGRLIFQKKRLLRDYITEPYEPVNRVVAQKSVFVQHPNGFIQPREADVINVPAVLKTPLLKHLEQHHGISAETVYNDLHGFIKNQGTHLEAYVDFYTSLTDAQKGDSENGNSNATGTL